MAARIRIDWLGVAIHDALYGRGHLVCGPRDGQYAVNFGGTIQWFDADDVLIQRSPRGGYEVFRGHETSTHSEGA